jgi:hypothetical protein
MKMWRCSYVSSKNSSQFNHRKTAHRLWKCVCMGQSLLLSLSRLGGGGLSRSAIRGTAVTAPLHSCSAVLTNEGLKIERSERADCSSALLARITCLHLQEALSSTIPVYMWARQHEMNWNIFSWGNSVIKNILWRWNVSTYDCSCLKSHDTDRRINSTKFFIRIDTVMQCSDRWLFRDYVALGYKRLGRLEECSRSD